LRSQLLSHGVDPDHHVTFFGLRTWDEYIPPIPAGSIGGSTAGGLSAGSTRAGGGRLTPKAAEKLGLYHLATELVYVHSKVLIADDQTAIIGSGNINDRSLLGTRDTEVAVVVSEISPSSEETGTNSSDGSSDGGGFVRSLRMRLFEEHWGVSASNDEADGEADAGGAGGAVDGERPGATDLHAALVAPHTDANFALLKAAAKFNSGVFAGVFPRFIPRNDIRSFEHPGLKSIDNKCVIKGTAALRERLARVRGHIVELPLDFLVDSDLRITDASESFLNDIFI